MPTNGTLVQLKQLPANDESIWEEVGAPGDESFPVGNGTKHVMRTAAQVAAILADKFVDLKVSRSRLTPEGGFAVKLTNKTGSTSVKGTVVQVDTSADNAVAIADADGNEAFGIIYEDGIANGEEVWVVTWGRVQVLLENTTAGTRANWVKTSSTAGRADATLVSPPGGGVVLLDEHMTEIGHCMQTISGGTDVLCWIHLQFN